MSWSAAVPADEAPVFVIESVHRGVLVINLEIAVPLVVAVATSVAVFNRWLQHRERLAELAARPAVEAGDADRLARVERAVEAVALEVERIGEGQRYLTRVLGERPRASAPSALPLPRTDTPH
jgi:hypothetical protein